MPGPTGPSPRMIGLIVASLMAVVFTLIIWRSMGTAPTQPANQGNLFPEDPSDVPDLADLEQGSTMFVTIVDRQDPTRIAGTLKADQFEPIGGGQRRLVNPDAWIYMRDGRRVHITADDGVVTMPDPNEAPDSGMLKGDVAIRLFDAVDDPADDVGDQSPTMTVRFDQPVEFERRYQRLTSEGRFTVESPGLGFIGHTLTVMLNEVQGRVELIDVRRGERLVLRPDAQQASADLGSSERRVVVEEPGGGGANQDTTAQDTTAPKAASRGTQHGTQIASKDQTPQTPEKRTPYHIEIKDSVLVDMVGTGTLKADSLDIWAMLIDGAMSAEAFKEIRFSADQVAKPKRQVLAMGSSQTVATDTPSAGKAADLQSQPESGEVVMTWAGPLVVRPIEDPDSTVLATEELALEFGSSTQVEFDSPAQGIHGSAGTLKYGATRGILELAGQNDAPVVIRVENAGTMRSEMILANLATGEISIDSSGDLETASAAGTPRARLSWNQSARFGLVMTQAGELTGRLKSAYFTGQVLGTRADAELRTQTLLAELDSAGPVESALRKITLNQGAIFSDSGSLSGDELAIGFVPAMNASSGAGVTPVSLNANGSVLGITTDGRIETDTLTAVLVREYDGQTRVRRATAIGKTSFLGQRETLASGARVDLNTDNNTIQIIGDAQYPGIAGQGGSLIHGSDIRINTRSRSILVSGPGSFDHDIAVEGSGGSLVGGGHLRVSWDESMRFDDALGSIECEGNVVAVSTPDAYTLDTLKADRLEIDLTPAPGDDQIVDPDAIVLDDDVARELFEARAFGRGVPGGDPIPASVESRSYDPKNPERAIGVMYLEGPQLIADNRAQVLRVPSAGMMMLMDRSEDQVGGEPGGSASVMPSTSGPGLTRLTWLGSMELDRTSGQALVLQEVNIRHKSLATGRVSELGCERLEASFSPAIDGERAGGIVMERAVATGRVRFTDLQRTLLSDHAIYDAVAETMFAFADDDRLVTLRDSTNPTPISARTLLWDLKKDLIEIDAPSPVRAPSRP